MPRKADPNLEGTILAAAMRLLQKGGLHAVTMREVAKLAGTTTPTLYERFQDRDALLTRITDLYRDRLRERMDPRDSLEQLGRKFLDFCAEHPYCTELLLGRVTENLRAKAKGPIFEMVRNNLMKVDGMSPGDAEDLTLATSSTMVGAAMLMTQLGRGSREAIDLQRATTKLLQRVTGSRRGKNGNSAGD